jgi:deoxyribodipyrimidine photolyase
LEEVAGLWNVKAEAYEGEVDVMAKKVKKMERRMSQAKSTAHKMTSEKINWEERFYKAVFIAEELIGRNKRELLGDMVELAKSCEFRLNKLKEGKDPDILHPSAGREAYSTITKKWSKTDKKERKSGEKNFLSAVKHYTESSGKPASETKNVLTECHSNFKTDEKSKKPEELLRAENLFGGNDENQSSSGQTGENMDMKIRR